MRRLTSAFALVASLSLLAACATSEAPGWTYAPAPSVTPAASGEASGSPVPSASAPASEEPSPTAAESEVPGSAEPSGSAGAGEGLTITAPVGAAVSGFDPTELQAPADATFEVTFDNQDTGVPHNWVLKNASGSNVDIGDTSVFNGVEQRTYVVPALAAGEYSFLCDVHPNTMTGTLTAG
jgi:plastocyanin